MNLKKVNKTKYILILFAICLCSSACSKSTASSRSSDSSKEAAEEMQQMPTWQAGEQICSKGNCEIFLASKKDNYICKVNNEKGENVYTEEFTTIVAPTVTLTDEAAIIHHGAGTGVYFDKVVSLDGKRKSEWMSNARLIGNKYVIYLDFDFEDPSKTQLVLKEIYNEKTQKGYPFPYLADEWDVETYEFQDEEKKVFVRYTDKDTKKTAEKVISLSEFK